MHAHYIRFVSLSIHLLPVYFACCLLFLRNEKEYIVVGDGGNREGHAKGYYTPTPSWNAYSNDTQFGHGTVTVRTPFYPPFPSCSFNFPVLQFIFFIYLPLLLPCMFASLINLFLLLLISLSLSILPIVSFAGAQFYAHAMAMAREWRERQH
jgi:hypothetical protein